MTYGGVSGESFSLDPNTGVLTTLRALDREEQEEINLTGTLTGPPKARGFVYNTAPITFGSVKVKELTSSLSALVFQGILSPPSLLYLQIILQPLSREIVAERLRNLLKLTGFGSSGLRVEYRL